MGAVARCFVVLVNCNRDGESWYCLYVGEDSQVVGDSNVGTAVDKGVVCSNGAGVVVYSTNSGLASNV